MGLPQKSYFHLTEIAERWGASMSDLACYTLDGLLEVSIMTITVRAEIGTFDGYDGGIFRLPEGEIVLRGPQPVVASDLWPVFRNGTGKITRFKPRTATGYLDLAEGVAPMFVRLADLLVTRAERNRFEMAHGLSFGDGYADGSQDAPGFIQRDNYAEVVLNGEIFRLGPMQAAIIRQLHEAARSESPWRRGKQLLIAANAQTSRMVDLFKTKPNWRSLIASDGRGAYRLNLPARPAARAAHRAYRRFQSAAAACG